MRCKFMAFLNATIIEVGHVIEVRGRRIEVTEIIRAETSVTGRVLGVVGLGVVVE